MLVPWKESYDKLRRHIKKQRSHFDHKGRIVKAMVFPVVTWELKHKIEEHQNNRCFPSVVLEKTLESPLDCKEVKLVNPKGDRLNIYWKDWCWSWSSNALTAWCKEPIHTGKDPDAGKDWRQKEKEVTEDEMVRSYQWLSEHEFEQTLVDSGGQRRLAAAVHGVTDGQTQANGSTATSNHLNRSGESIWKYLAFTIINKLGIEVSWLDKNLT